MVGVPLFSSPFSSDSSGNVSRVSTLNRPFELFQYVCLINIPRDNTFDRQNSGEKQGITVKE
jgi:hypothetical protein